MAREDEEHGTFQDGKWKRRVTSPPFVGKPRSRELGRWYSSSAPQREGWRHRRNDSFHPLDRQNWHTPERPLEEGQAARPFRNVPSTKDRSREGRKDVP